MIESETHYSTWSNSSKDNFKQNVIALLRQRIHVKFLNLHLPILLLYIISVLSSLPSLWLQSAESQLLAFPIHEKKHAAEWIKDIDGIVWYFGASTRENWSNNWQFSCHVEQGLGIEKIGIYNWLCWAIFFSGPFRWGIYFCFIRQNIFLLKTRLFV